MRPRAQGRLASPEAGRGGKDPPLEPPEGARPWDTLTSDVWSPGWGRMQVCGFKPSSLGSFVTPAHFPQSMSLGGRPAPLRDKRRISPREGPDPRPLIPLQG